MSTTLFYNGVTLSNCWTKRFSQTMEMDESGTDLVFHKFTIRVQSVATAAANLDFGANPAGTPPSAAAAPGRFPGPSSAPPMPSVNSRGN
mgnify:CR=1 FL=1